MHSENNRREGFVETPHVRLQYLDWGGKGQVLMLLCGLGDTPFIYDSIAKDLSNNFHVIGYSRRNHGRSTSADEKNDNSTLVTDLKLILDSLRIEKANLLGWSMGGNEITEFAILYPERVNRLIYFESGYDLSDDGFEKLVSNLPESFHADSSVMKSMDSYREWFHHFWFGDMEWNDVLEANLQASVRVNDNGSFEAIPDERAFKSTLQEAMKYRRRYEDVAAPSLVIYTKPFFYPANDDPTTVQQYENIERDIVSPWREASRKRVQEELRSAVIVDAPRGSHTSFLFLSHSFLIKTIGNFLNGEK